MTLNNVRQLGRGYGGSDVDRLVNQVVHLQGQVGPVDLNGRRVNAIEQQLLREQAASKAGADIAYDRDDYTVPEEIIEGIFYDEVYPEQTFSTFTPRKEIIAALEGPPPKYKSESKEVQRKASEAFEKKYGLSAEEEKVVEQARQLVQRELDLMGALGLGGTAAVLGGGVVVPDGNSDDNLQDALVAAALMGVGGVSGHHVGAGSYKPQSQRIADRQHSRGLKRGDGSMYGADAYVKPLTGSHRSQLMAQDARNRGARGRAGMAVGAGAGALLGLIQAIREDNPPEVL